MSDQTEWPDLMCDIESGGLSPDRTPMIQLAAVRFNLKEGTICHDLFCKSLSVPPWRHWDEETRAWWMGQKQSVFEEIVAAAEKPEGVMNSFFDWVVAGKSKHFWSKPLSFDWPFVQSYLRDFGLPMPMHYRLARDVNTFIHALHFPEDPPKVEVSDTGDKHHALNDCFFQIETVVKHYHLAKGNKQN